MRLAEWLDATFIEQRYSRLVIDCNRDPENSESITTQSDGTEIPGNSGVSDKQRSDRASEIFWPYHHAITELLDHRQEMGKGPIIVSLHSFTPQLHGNSRPWELGVLHDAGEHRFAKQFLEALRIGGEFVVGDNEPYKMDATDFTIPFHAYPRKLAYVEIEIRQDVLARQTSWKAIMKAIVVALSAADGTEPS